MTRPDEIHDVLEHLATLAPTEADAPRPAPQVLAQLKQRIDERNYSPEERLSWRFMQMFKRKYAFATFFVLLFLVVAFSLPPVRAAASDFLGLFRVQKFAAISVSPRQLAMLEEVAEQGLQPGELELVEEPGPAQSFTSPAEASIAAGLRVKTVEALGAPDEIRVTGGGSGRLTIDLESARRILEMAEVNPRLLPDSLDGANVDVTIFPSVEQTWDEGVTLLQTESPVIDYPDDVNPALLGQALLRMLGMTPGEARRLAANIDWTSTLLLPIPEDLATFNEVEVAGTTGLALSSVDGEGNVIMWQRDGVLFLLIGDQSIDDLGEIADSLG